MEGNRMPVFQSVADIGYVPEGGGVVVLRGGNVSRELVGIYTIIKA